MPKSKGVHASGFEVAPNNLLSNLPLWLGKEGDMVTQYEGAILENLGYIKLDILGVKVLSIIEIALVGQIASHSPHPMHNSEFTLGKG